MQDTIWDDKESPQSTIKQTPHTSETSFIHTTQDCLTYGHDWQTTEILGEKQCEACEACEITGYCPGCTPIAPQSALPFFCTRHTPLVESQVSA